MEGQASVFWCFFTVPRTKSQMNRENSAYTLQFIDTKFLPFVEKFQNITKHFVPPTRSAAGLAPSAPSTTTVGARAAAAAGQRTWPRWRRGRGRRPCSRSRWRSSWTGPSAPPPATSSAPSTPSSSARASASPPSPPSSSPSCTATGRSSASARVATTSGATTYRPACSTSRRHVIFPTKFSLFI